MVASFAAVPEKAGTSFLLLQLLLVVVAIRSFAVRMLDLTLSLQLFVDVDKLLGCDLLLPSVLFKLNLLLLAD